MIEEKLEGEESFADLLAQSLKAERKTVHAGEKVTGVVVQVGAERAIVDLGHGQDALIDLSELAARGEAPQVKKGDRIEAYVARIENRMAILAKTLGKGPGARAALDEAFHTGVPVEGTVVEVNKGGYVVEVAGSRCFCPLGQMDTRRIDDPKTMIGQKLAFRIQELRGGRDIVLSRRALLEAEQAERAEQTRKRLEIGARFSGTVTSVRDFGAFVDIGGLEGMIPVSELGYGRKRPAEVVRVGQTVEVEVLRREPPGPKDRSERITLSMRSLTADPWDETVDALPEGSIVRGTVVRLQPFGAFVEIVPGVDGLLHVSAFGKRVAQPSDVVAVGDSIAVRVDGIDREHRRISLAYVAPEDVAEIAPEAPAEEPAPDLAQPVVEPPKPRKDPSDPAAGLRVRRLEKAAPTPVAKPAEPNPKLDHPAKPRIIGQASPPAPSRVEVPPVVRAPRIEVGQVFEVTVDKIEPFGLFVKWGQSRGLIPSRELELPKSGDMRKAFPVGATLKAAITEVRGDGKISLSAKEAIHAEERAEARDWMKSQRSPAATGKGFGTLGDLLRGAGK